ncbi:DUF3024 domain-containing protein [Pseudonocardia humida]|uniref:DUF3024 domain-containing protein n=1 Tax=Pseudonocardia humida TaxID=2800819 RepID=UPI003FD77B75
MVVPEEIRHRLSQWCTARIPDEERRQRQIGYTISGDEVTILDRRAPTYPELNTAWSSTPMAMLRSENGAWTLYRPVGDDGWQGVASGTDPLALLDGARD